MGESSGNPKPSWPVDGVDGRDEPGHDESLLSATGVCRSRSYTIPAEVPPAAGRSRAFWAR